MVFTPCEIKRFSFLRIFSDDTHFEEILIILSYSNDHPLPERLNRITININFFINWNRKYIDILD